MGSVSGKRGKRWGSGLFSGVWGSLTTESGCQAIRGKAGRASGTGTGVEGSPGTALPGNVSVPGEVYNDAMELIEAVISFVCLVSLIVILLEARRSDGLQRRGPVFLWAVGLIVLALLALLRVWANLDAWNDLRILMGIVSVGNFLFGAGLLARWLMGRPVGG